MVAYMYSDDQGLEAMLVAFASHKQEAGLEVEKVGLDLVSMWDAGAAG